MEDWKLKQELENWENWELNWELQNCELKWLEQNWESILALMDDELREKLLNDLAPCTKEEFFYNYLKAHLAKYGKSFAY